MPLLYSVTTPAVVIFPIRLPNSSVNHRLPSGPAVMPSVMLYPNAPGVMPLLNSVTTWAHAPPDSKQVDASMQPNRMRSHFMFGSPLTYVGSLRHPPSPMDPQQEAPPIPGS